MAVHGQFFFQQLHGKRSNSSGSIDALQEWVKRSDNNFHKYEVLRKNSEI